MGISLGWVVFFAAGVIAAPPADRNAAQISFKVRMVEANGVGWREAVFTRLKPVARQGAATIWTLPGSDSIKILEYDLEISLGPQFSKPHVLRRSREYPPRSRSAKIARS